MRIDPSTSTKIRGISLFCSLMICLNHSYTVPTGFTEIAGEPWAFTLALIENSVKFGIARISTPFFFAVAGFMVFAVIFPKGLAGGELLGDASHDRYLGEIAKRVRSLVVPYLIMCVWSYLLILGLQSLPGLAGHAEAPLAARGWLDTAQTLFWNPVAYPLWFLRDLFLLCLSIPLIALVLRYRALAVVAFAIALAAWFTWFELRMTRSIVFFSFGGYLAMHRPRIVAPGRIVLGAAAAAWIGLVVAHAIWVADHGMTNAVLNNCAILIGLVTVWFGYEYVRPIGDRPRVQAAAAFTFFVYLVHEPFATLGRKAMVAYFGVHDHHAALLGAWLLLGCGIFAGGLTTAALLQRNRPMMPR